MNHTANPYILQSVLCLATILSAGCDAGSVENGLEAPVFSDADVERIELETEDFSESIGEDMRLLAQMRSPGGSLVAFIADENDDITILEHGVDGTVPVSDVPELARATAYETFVAIADNDAVVPPEIVQAHVAARGSLESLDSLEGFELQDVPGFGLQSDDNGFRAFSSCTNDLAWALSSSGVPKFYNCAPDNVGECRINFLLNSNTIIDDQTGFKRNNRFSTCHRGGGTMKFTLTSVHNGTFNNFFSRTSSSTGAYYRAWRQNGSESHRWSAIQFKAGGTGNPRVNTSLWGRNYFPSWF